MIAVSQRRFVNREGLALAADMAGPPDGAAVILLHGGGQTRHSWDGGMRRLAADGYFVINYDARGHGDSDWSPTADYSFGAVASDLLDILTEIDRPAALVGASMGGISSFLAIGTSDRPVARALVMVDIALRPAVAGTERIMRFMMAHREGFSDLDEAARAVAAYNPDRQRTNDSSGLRKNLRQHDDGRYYWHWDPRLLESDARGIAMRYEALVGVSDRVIIPTLLVRGRSSDVLTDENVADLVRHVPQTEVFEVPGAGHMVAGDRNDAFNDGVLAFLKRHHPPR